MSKSIPLGLAELCSEEDEDEEEETAAVKAEPDSNAMDEDAEQVPVKSKPKRDLHELAEYSPDELQAVKKDFLNGEITQLEGTGAKHELD